MVLIFNFTDLYVIHITKINCHVYKIKHFQQHDIYFFHLVEMFWSQKLLMRFVLFHAEGAMPQHTACRFIKSFKNENFNPRDRSHTSRLLMFDEQRL